MSAALASMGALQQPGRPLVERARILSPLALLRAQVSSRATALGADGVTWGDIGADVTRFHGAARRLLVEGQRTNLVSNPRFEGAVAGTPGTTPTNWTTWTATGSGITRQIVGIGTANGLPYIDVRYFGTPTSTTGVSISSPSNVVTAGTTYANSAWVALIAGSAANVSLWTLRCAGEASGTNFTPGATLTRVVNTRTLAGTTSNISFRITYTNTTDPVDFTLRIAGPQCELGASASSLVLPPVGSPAVSTRGAELVTATLASLGIGANGACTVLGAALLPQQASSGVDQILAQIDDGTTSNLFRLRNSAGGATLVGGHVLAGATTDAASAGSMTGGTLFRWGMSLNGAGRIASCVNGATAQAATGGPLTGLTTLRIGNNGSNSSPAFMELAQLRVLPFAVPDSGLRSLVASLPG